MGFGKVGFGKVGFGEVGIGEVGFGRVGFGELGGHPGKVVVILEREQNLVKSDAYASRRTVKTICRY